MVCAASTSHSIKIFFFGNVVGWEIKIVRITHSGKGGKLMVMSLVFFKQVI